MSVYPRSIDSGSIHYAVIEVSVYKTIDVVFWLCRRKPSVFLVIWFYLNLLETIVSQWVFWLERQKAEMVSGKICKYGSNEAIDVCIHRSYIITADTL